MANLVTSTSLAAFATAYKTTISHIGVGSSPTPPTLGDTNLITPITPRKATTVETATGASVTFETFYSTSEGNGTIAEVGLFSTLAGLDCGARALLSTTQTKTSSKTMLVTFTVTFANA